MRILSVSGSLRFDSSNCRVLHAAGLLAPAGVRVSMYEGLADLPHFNPDLDVDPVPAAVAALRRTLLDSDAVLFSVPEYAHGVPGSLKNMLDWLVGSGELVDMRVGSINTSLHAVHAQPALIETLVTMSADVRQAACLTVPLARRPLEPEAIAAEPALAAPLRAALAALIA